MQGSDARSPEAQSYRAMYATPEWRAIRKRRKAIEPHCRMCARLGRATPVDIVDHIEPHRGDRSKFFDLGNTQSLCHSHHSSNKQRAEKGRPVQAIGRDGWPV